VAAPFGPAAPDGNPRARLDTLPTRPPELTLGYEALRWAVKYLVQPNGPRAGLRYKPTPRQALFWLHWYGIHPDGSWMYHRGVRRLAKGSGKSPNAGAYGLIELCAPVRLFDFDSSRPGGCKGTPVSMPLVQIAAVSEAQTENTMRMVRAFARKGSRIVADHGLDPGLKIYHKAGDGKLEVVTNSYASLEGAEPTAAVGDETEHWLGKDGTEFGNTLADNLAKSGNRLLETCNAWKPGVGSFAESTFDTWVDQEERLARGEGTKSGSLVLYDARQAPPDTDLRDRDSLIRALDYVYEDCWWANKQFYITRIWDKGSRPSDSKRKYLNWPTAPEGAWCTAQQWQRLAADGNDGRPLRELVDGERIVLFFDGSKSRDATALVGCCLSDGHVFTVRVWEPQQSKLTKPDDTEDAAQADTAQIDAAEVDAVVSATFEKYAVVAFWGDVREFEGYVKTTWPERWRDQLDPKLWAVKTGKLPEPIAWDMRSHGREFSFAAELVENEISDHAFTHDGDAVTERHIVNARRKDTQWGAVTIAKETPNSPDKIDAAVCVIGARMLYRIALANAPEEEEPGEAYFVNRWG